MFDIINKSTTDLTTGLISAGVAGGIIYGIATHRSNLGIFGFAMGFGLLALAASTVIGQITN